MSEEEKNKIGEIFDLTKEEVQRIDTTLDVTKYLITEIDIKDFCKKEKMNYRSVYRYLFAITHPNVPCARCASYEIFNECKKKHILIDYNLFPCNRCLRNPKLKDYFSDGLS